MEVFFLIFLCRLMFRTSVRHPFAFGALLLLRRITVGGFVRVVAISWYGFVLFLIFVGGLLVLFRYTCALAPKVNPWKGDSNSMRIIKKAGFYVGSLAVAFLLVLRARGLGLLEGRINSSLIGSVASRRNGVLIVSFIWGTSIVWLVLILFLVIVLVAHICKKQRYPLRSFKLKKF